MITIKIIITMVTKMMLLLLLMMIKCYLLIPKQFENLLKQGNGRLKVLSLSPIDLQ